MILNDFHSTEYFLNFKIFQIFQITFFPSYRYFCHFNAGRLIVDFIPDVHIESLKTIISRHKLQFAVNNGSDSKTKNLLFDILLLKSFIDTCYFVDFI